MAQEIPFGVQKELITPRSVAVAIAAHWVLLALCDARILFPFSFPLAREVFWGFFTLAFPVLFPLTRGFLGFLCFENSFIFPFFPLKGLGF